MNIDRDDLKERLHDYLGCSFTYHENTMEELLDDKKITANKSIKDENNMVVYTKTLQVVHLSHLFKSFFKIHTEDINFIMKKGANYVSEFVIKNTYPNNYDKASDLLHILLEEIDEIVITTESICFFSGYIDSLELLTKDLKNIMSNIFKKCINEEKPLTNEYKYYVQHYFYDSYDSEYELLSKDNKIIFKTKLTNKSMIHFLMIIFHKLYNKKYYLLIDNYYFKRILNIHHIFHNGNNITCDKIISLFDSIDISEYITEFDSIPDELNNSKCRKKQKVYTLNDIKKLI
jgi:hypothetical protein